MLLGNGKVLAYFYDENRIPVPLSKIAPVMRQAQLAIEDHRFYEHGALDFKGTLRALIRNTTSEDVQGGSSITQQYVKMVQVEACTAKGDTQCVKEAQAPTLERKIRELRYAIAMEKKFTKDQILERYLNIAYYGQGAYGVEAAARHYYSTKPTSSPCPRPPCWPGWCRTPTPSTRCATRSAALDRRDVVINRMAELKLITADQAKKAKKVGFDQEGQADPQRLRGHAVPVPVRLRLRDAAEDPQPRQDGRGPGEHDQAWRPDHPDRHRPQVPGPGPEEGQRRGRSDRPDHLDHEHDPAGYRPDRGHGPEPAGDGQQQEEG